MAMALGAGVAATLLAARGQDTHAPGAGLRRRGRPATRRITSSAAAATCAVAACVLGRIAGALALVGTCAATWLLGRAITARIAGLTGDTYGAIAEVTEVVTLFLLALLGGNRMLLAITL